MSEVRISKKKEVYPVSDDLWNYLQRYQRHVDMPNIYERLRGFIDVFPLQDRDGNETLWLTPVYHHHERQKLNAHLCQIYTMLKTGSQSETLDHLSIERIDYCEFGNSKPFRIRVVNAFNDNYDHFYVKHTDASRIYGLELEHVLSPNRINYLISGGTLVEEHIVGIPGDIFINNRIRNPEVFGLNKVRIAKEFVKFNERCFMRLLGDMRSYNYVVDITPDIEDEEQYRVRAIDFDQQSYEGQMKMYLPQFFKENSTVVQMVSDVLNYTTMKQYQYEERVLISRRVNVSQGRLSSLFRIMRKEPCSTPEKIEQLKRELGAHNNTRAYERCETMGDLVAANVDVILSRERIVHV